MSETGMNALQLFRKAAKLRQELNEAVLALDAKLAGGPRENTFAPQYHAIHEQVELAVLVVDNVIQIDTNMLEKLREAWSSIAQQKAPQA